MTLREQIKQLKACYHVIAGEPCRTCQLEAEITRLTAARAAEQQRAEQEINLLKEGMEAANALVASIRAAVWEALPSGRDVSDPDRSLVGMVKLLGRKLDEARDNRRGEFELREQSEARLSSLTTQIEALVKAWRDDLQQHREWMLDYERKFDGGNRHAEAKAVRIITEHIDTLAALTKD